MKIFKIIFVFFSFFPLQASAQSWLWGREATPIKGDNGEHGEILIDHAVAVDRDGDAYATGYFYDTLFFGKDTLISKGMGVNNDAGRTEFLVKYNSSGNILWADHCVNMSGQNVSAGNSVAIDGSGNAYVTGSFTDTVSFGLDTLKERNNTYSNLFLTKYDVQGNVLWSIQAPQLADSNYIEGNSIAIDGSGDAHVTGSFIDTSYINIGIFNLPVASSQVFLSKYNANGTVLWTKKSTGSSIVSNGIGESVALDVPGNTYVLGNFKDTLFFGVHRVIDKNSSVQPDVYSNLFLAKYDINGNARWAAQAIQASSASWCLGSSVAIDGSGNAYATGSFYDTVSFGAYTLIANNNISNFYGDVFLTKYDSNGNVIWAKQGTVLDNNPWTGFSVACDTLKRGGGYLTIDNFLDGYIGTTPATYELKFGTDIFSLSPPNNGDATIYFQFDSSGNVLCGSIFSEGIEDDGDAIGVDHSGQYIYIGGDVEDTTVFGPDTLPYGNEVPFIARWKACCGKIPINVVPLDTTICIGKTVTLAASGGISYVWNPSNGLSCNPCSNPTAAPTTPISYTVTGTDANGCSNTASTTINLSPPPTLKVSSNQTICPGKSATISALGNGTGFIWQPGNNTNSTITVAPTQTTDYIATLSSGCGTAIDTVIISVNPAPIPAFSADVVSGCSPLCIQFNNITTISSGIIQSYKWFFCNGDSISTPSPIYCYPNPGNFSVSLTAASDNGCSATFSNLKYITVYNNPQVNFLLSPQPATILQPTIQFSSNSTDAYGIADLNWRFGDASDSSSQSQHTSHTYTDTGTYCATLVVMNIHGCVDSITNCLVIDPIFTLYIPSAFTPNGDGLNEIFQPKGNDIKSLEMFIFDRWGVELFHSTDTKQGWDGTLNGSSCQEDSYIYVITVYDSENREHNYTGVVNLLK